MAFGEPGVKALACLGRRLRRCNAQDVEAEGDGPLGEGRLERRAAQKSRFS
jgi:hypothetical protein